MKPAEPINASSSSGVFQLTTNRICAIEKTKLTNIETAKHAIRLLEEVKDKLATKEK